MKKFRQKEFNKIIDYLGKHPTLPISTGTLIFSGSNYITNSRRYNKDRKYQKDQLKAMENLTNSLTDTVNSMKDMNSSLKNVNKELISERGISSKMQQRDENKKSSFFGNIFRRKNYSIQDGSYTGNKRLISNGSYKMGALIGAGIGLAGTSVNLINNPSVSNKLKATTIGVGTILGAGIGALTGYLKDIIDKSIFNKGLSKINSYDIIDYIDSIYYTEDVEKKTISKITPTNKKSNYFDLIEEQEEITKKVRPSVNPRGIIYDIDGDPKKYTLNLMCRGNVMVILFNDPSKYDLKGLNSVLDNYCRDYKNADYISNKISKNSYTIEINIVEGAYESLIRSLINSGFKLNIITGNKI